MSRRGPLVISIVLCLALLPGSAVAAGPQFKQGSSGVGDPYFPDDGNGGYDVQHYALDLSYAPATDTLTGVATITALATENLSRFNLDLDGLTVRSISTGGKAARWQRVGGELRITPSAGITSGSTFTTVIAYDGVPALYGDPGLGESGFFHTDDGAIIAGEPHGASTWFPANDHPSDKASYGFRIRVPAGLTAVANGSLVGSSTSGGWTTWTWDAPTPMATYLATMAIGEFDLHAWQRGGIDYWDATDPDLWNPIAAPRTGSVFALSQPGDAAYRRLATTVAVPAGGATLSFWITRATEDWWDFVAVEAHHPGVDDWTTLPDANGHTGQDGGGLCLYSSAHPFLAHYFTVVTDPDTGDASCDPTGTTGAWNAASGFSDGYEQWTIDLGAYAGGSVELAISYITDESYQFEGAFVDDVAVSTGQGSTGFEDGTLAPWTTPAAPAGSPRDRLSWIAGGAGDVATPLGDGIQASLDRQPDFLKFQASVFGPYPFAAAGGIIDDTDQFGFALETQTRPVYARAFFGQPDGNDFVFVHELAHQWYGDSLAVARWQDIWLNEGFATYAEWLWSEHEGYDTAQQIFDFWAYDAFAPDDPFWQLTIGDPGPEHLFDFEVYVRGAMTLHALRLQIGDSDFFDLLKTWATSKAGGNVTTPEFIALAEQISGQDLDALFQTYLYTGANPVATSATTRATAAASSLADAPAAARSLYERYGRTRGLHIGR